MTDVQPGDKVRLTVDGGRIRGTFTIEGIAYEDVAGIAVGDRLVNFEDATVEVLERALPPEPPMGSIVVVRGFAYQCRYDGRWYRIATSATFTWRDVCAHDTPTVVWQP